MFQLLFAEDELSLGQLVKDALEAEPDFKVLWVTDGKAAIEAFGESNPDICILDVMLPHVDGFKVAEAIRRKDKSVPILFLTARLQTQDVVKGFGVGGNDYIKKPFSVVELVIRIRELLRRSGVVKSGESSTVFRIGGYVFTPDKHILQFEAYRYNLTYREAELLRKLVVNKNNLTDRKEVLTEIWGDDDSLYSRSMDVYIAKLRKYLSRDPRLSIINIRGLGYKLIEEV